MHNCESQSLPDYKKPPVTEVVCGIAFEKIESFRAHHLGLFWQKVKGEFPTCQHAARLGSVPLPFKMEDYLPRVWFVSDKQNKLVQLQDDRFYFNWRKTVKGEAYPRYSKIIKAFKAHLRTFQEFLEEEDLGSVNPDSCELTYINHIPKGEGWESMADMTGVFRDITWDKDERFLKDPLSLEGRVVFPLRQNKGRLHITISHGERQHDMCPVIVLEISARSPQEKKSMQAVWEWFEVAHEGIVCGFADLTELTIQKDVWQRIDAT